jgi:predicted nucleic acid-binding protein
MSYLIDTNVISELIKPRPNKAVLEWFTAIPEDSLYLSVITLGEIRKGIEKISEPHKKEKLRIWLEHELPAWFGSRLLPIDKHIADCWGLLQAQTLRTLPAIDSLLAATAISASLYLVTRNVFDFESVALRIINPWDT